ncbi:MAG: RNA polymerase sigma factor [Bacteroidota bacterium]
MNETQIIPQLKKGNENAFRALVDTFQEKVLNTCLGFVPNRHDAEDIVQEVFIEVFRSIGQFRGESKLSTWIYRITTTKCLEHIRARKRQKRLSFFQSLIGMHENADRIKAYDFDHPGVLLENKERSKVLFQHIDQLPENQRVAFTLHKIEGLSYQEITAIMQTSLSSVESLMFRAKRNLKKSLASFYKKNM